MTQNNYKLTYFNVEALGEPIRWIFKYAEVEFEDDRVPWNLVEWITNRKKDFPNSVGQMPVLVINGKDELCQSSAISRYLADEFNLLGETKWDRARGDEVVSLIFDLFDVWRKNAFERDLQRKADNQKNVDSKFRQYYAKFNQLLEEVEGDFLNGTKLTYADFWIASFVNSWNNPIKGPKPVLPPGISFVTNSYVNLADEYPALKRHQEKILAIPQIKKWIAERP